MAKRMIDTDLWNDSKIMDNFTPEDKYFWLFLLTTRYANVCGVFEISVRQMGNDLGYNKETVENLIYRFKNIHKMIDYDYDTKEIYIYNWYKYNWTKSPKLKPHIKKFINLIKTEYFKESVINTYEKYVNNEEISIPYRYDTISNTISITNTISNSNKELIKEVKGGKSGGKNYHKSIEIRDKSIKTNNKHLTLKEKKETKKTKETPKRYTNEIKEIISIYNKIVGSNYTFKNETNNRLIRARLKEGATISDFEKVIKSKYNEWKDTDMKVYIRPSTLFTSKFHDYLAVAGMSKKENETDDFYKQFEI